MADWPPPPPPTLFDWLRGGEEFNCMREKGEVGVSAGAEGEEKKKTGKERGRKTKKLPKKVHKMKAIKWREGYEVLVL